ncbi:hypothetical protein DDB_G0282853 [Dictyostelium discoideum AX4]|uniref:Translationally-controlled tumor protein homolog 1 n=1 Tax=Dictyostelium discoideum TaxID=44689 RepID=TCTP1_DICDI|nr:hypothetical protein DDB_G0282853 [Dictyostelium discoideum AX4]Q54RX6.1 RecName: Full=Translationally-controlled tumor protein homolog 1; Short=TCTP 1 [Dictyostelium discoideum]EAL66006.1 hypothetical protein DDB_G0282853 [Dictyostelium discoideum AX4]|eukprot:XP_639361.1 hypothetical protein DDB_G0282853 [Dictyostelium discoideum AX4]
MRVFKDIVGYSHDELCSDAYPMTEINNGLIYEVQAKMVTIDLDVKVNTGANAASEETEEDEGVDNAGSKQVINVVDAMRLVETSFDKKSYTGYIKAYMKEVLAKLADNNPSRVDAFKKDAADFVKSVLGKFDEYKFYTGENMDADGHVALMYYKPGEVDPIFLYFKDGLESVKY